MKVCVTSATELFEGKMDPRFGRAPFLIIFDTEHTEIESCQNPGLSQSSGAGSRTAQFLDSKNVKTVLTGHIGPNAAAALKAAGISTVTGLSGTVQSVYERFKSGDLVPARYK